MSIIPDWSQCYEKISAHAAETGAWETWSSPALNDPWWDDFLRSAPCGQFQQSSLWAEYKLPEGWHYHRVVITGRSGIVGGFQILWKKVWLTRLGYVSKGPVAHPESPALVGHLERLLGSATRQLGLTALIVQQPDETQIALPAGGEAGLNQSNPGKVMEATYLVDVNEEMEVLRSRMSPSLRRNLRQARKRHGVVREGTEADLPLFFGLMASTCRRQLTTPNPGSIDAVRRLWSIFSRSHSIRVTIAECNGAEPAAKLSLIFGQLVTVWKKGWDGSHGNWHPNELLEEESLEWARARGYRACDFCSFNRSAAERILQGISVGGNGLSSRDEYHIRFGGRPKLLPRSLVLMPNPVLRWAYLNTYGHFEQRRERHLLAAAKLVPLLAVCMILISSHAPLGSHAQLSLPSAELGMNPS